MKLWLRNIALLVLMLAASGLAVALKPTHRMADQGPAIDLQKIVPGDFDGWREEKQSAVQIVDPEEKELLDKLYSQTLSRTYVNAQGYRIMLSLAYGGDQTRDQGVHRPEVCYSAQGFQVGGTQKVALQVNGVSIPAMRLEARFNQRVEPVTYWVRLGGGIVRGNLELGMARLSYGIRGQIADGLLFRVSSIDGDTANAYVQQDRFINDLIKAMAPEDRRAVLGSLDRPS